MEDEDTGKPQGIQVCDLHQNVNKEIGVIKSMFTNIGKKVDRATVAFLCLAGFIALDTVIIMWKFVVAPVLQTAFLNK